MLTRLPHAYAWRCPISIGRVKLSAPVRLEISWTFNTIEPIIEFCPNDNKHLKCILYTGGTYILHSNHLLTIILAMRILSSRKHEAPCSSAPKCEVMRSRFCRLLR